MENENLKYKIIEEEPNIVWVNPGLLEDRLDAEFFKNKFLKYIEIEQNNKLKYQHLGNIATNFSYGTPPYGNLAEKGVPYLRVPNIVGNFFLTDKNLGFISEEYHNDNIRNKVKKGDILFRVKGQLGISVVVPERFDGAHAGSSFLKISLKEKYCPYFISLYISSKYGRNQILRKQSNSIINYLNISDVKSLKIPILSSEIQNYIGEKVRRAEELREEANKLKKKADKIIYKYLGGFPEEILSQGLSFEYINVEGIFDRIDPKYYHKKYYDLISKLKEKHYQLKPLASLCSEIFNGRTKKTGYKEKSTSYQLTVANLENWWPKTDTEKAILSSNVKGKYISKKGDIVWCNSAHKASYIGENVNIIVEDNKFIPSNEITLIRPKEEKILPEFLFLYMNSDWGYYQIQRTVKGTTAHSYPDDIKRILVPIIDLKDEEKELIKQAVYDGYDKIIKSKQLIQEAKQDVEDLIEGKLDIENIK